MTDSSVSSFAQRMRPVSAGAAVVAVHFLDRNAAFVLGDEAVLLVRDDGEQRRVGVHGGAVLSAASDGGRLVTGGDDGRVVATNSDGGTTVVAADEKGRWIDHVAIAPDGTIAWSAGKTVFVKPPKGETKTLDFPSSAGGIAFAPKGLRLAIAHYNGASLWFPNAQAKPEVLSWKGSHLGVAFSPDGKFLITAMQEPTLHGWRLADGKDMRMSGYATRVRSLAWTADGHFLATGGSNKLILWNFQGKDGPMGKEPRMLLPYSERLNTVACHPGRDAVAAGFADGLVMLVRISDGAEILVKKPGGSPASAVSFSPDGTLLAFGCENGEAGVVDLA